MIQGSASEACLVALLAAKCRKMQDRLPEDALRLVAYASDQAHSCLKKACMIAGIENCRILPTTSAFLLSVILRTCGRARPDTFVLRYPGSAL